MQQPDSTIDKRPPPDYRDHFEIGQGGDDDDSFRRWDKRPRREIEPETMH